MSASEILKAVIEKYELSEPVPQDVRISMIKSRKRNLILILNQDAKGGLFVSAVVSLFLWVKKLGISISIIKSAIAVSMALIIGAGLITAAGLYTAGMVVNYFADEKQTIDRIDNVSTVPEEKPVSPVVQDILFYSVAVSMVEMEDAPDKLISDFTTKVISELRNIKGAKAAIDIKKLDKYHKADKILTISIIKLDEKTSSSDTGSIYRISAKIVNSNNSRVLMYSSTTAEDRNNIPDSLRKLAEKISVQL
jgi:hypothetical protein